MVEISLKAEELFHIGSFPVTNAIMVALAGFALFSAFGLVFRRKLALVPAGFQNAVEFAVEGLLNTVMGVLQSREKAEKYLPLIATIFFFVMITNWMGLLPGVGSLGIYGEHEGREAFIPFFRAPATDLNFTIGLAIIAVFGVNLFAMLAVGVRRRLSAFFTFKNPIYTFVGLLEFISELAKIVSFSFRLFGNIFAGEVLLTIIGFLLPFAVPLPFLFLEIFVGFVQAFVFAMLTTVFIAIATAEQEH